jgi:hypothetical protein
VEVRAGCVMVVCFGGTTFRKLGVIGWIGVAWGCMCCTINERDIFHKFCTQVCAVCASNNMDLDQVPRQSLRMKHQVGAREERKM